MKKYRVSLQFQADNDREAFEITDQIASRVHQVAKAEIMDLESEQSYFTAVERPKGAAPSALDQALA